MALHYELSRSSSLSSPSSHHDSRSSSHYVSRYTSFHVVSRSHYDCHPLLNTFRTNRLSLPVPFFNRQLKPKGVFSQSIKNKTKMITMIIGNLKKGKVGWGCHPLSMANCNVSLLAIHRGPRKSWQPLSVHRYGSMCSRNGRTFLCDISLSHRGSVLQRQSFGRRHYSASHLMYYISGSFQKIRGERTWRRIRQFVIKCVIVRKNLIPLIIFTISPFVIEGILKGLFPVAHCAGRGTALPRESIKGQRKRSTTDCSRKIKSRSDFGDRQVQGYPS